MIQNKYKILLVEDEMNIRNLVSTALQAEGYQTVHAGLCKTAKFLFTSYMPDLVILDLGLPDGDGLEILEFIRKDSLVPVIVLSARTDESDKITALDKGANDYITKPFGTAELLARVRAALRNSGRRAESAASDGKFLLHDLEIDYDRRRVLVAGQDTRLTQTEYNIVALLSAHAGKVLTYDYIMRELWGPGAGKNNQILRVNMANIRRKIEQNPAEPKHIFTEVGVGYRMAENA